MRVAVSDFQELGLENRALPAFRTKADCLRICAKGPIAVVYPDQVIHLQDLCLANVKI